MDSGEWEQISQQDPWGEMEKRRGKLQSVYIPVPTL